MPWPRRRSRVSAKKPDPGQDIFSSLPPREPFAAFPSLEAFPEQAIAFLTGKGEPVAPPPSPAAAQPEVASPAAPATPATSAAASPPAGPGATRGGKAKSINPDSQPVRQPDKPSVSPSVSRSVSRTANRFGSRTATQAAGPSATQSAILSDSSSVAGTEDLVAGPLPGVPAADTSSAAAAAGPVRPPAVSLPGLPVLSGQGDRLNANQRAVLGFLLRARPYIIKFRDIAAACRLPEATVRTILRRLQDLGLVAFKKARDGNIQGVRLDCNLPLARQYGFDPSLSHTQSRSESLTEDETTAYATYTVGRQPAGQAACHQAIQQAEPQGVAAAGALRPKPRDWQDAGGEAQAAFGWDDAFLELMWPAVFAAGFRAAHIGLAAAARARLDKVLDKASVRLSLERAEWELEQCGALAEPAGGETARDPAQTLFAALARFGVLPAHPDYVSREEAAVAGVVAELARRQEAAAALEETRFAAWREALSADEAAALLAGCADEDREGRLRAAWRERNQGD